MADLAKTVTFFFLIIVLHIVLVFAIQYAIAFVYQPGPLALIIAIIIGVWVLTRSINKFFDYILREE